jgi:hypothetical protein
MSEQQLFGPLERLGAEVERMALAAEPGAPRRGRRRVRAAYGRRPGLVIALVLLLLLAAAAGIAATTGLLSGAPVVGHGPPPRPNEGVGSYVPGSARLTTLRVADPGGGPPWGLRTLRTTRGTACVQVGRVVDGQLGVLGRDGAFRDDGLFHVLPPALLEAAQCTPLDRAGHAFLAASFYGWPASGYSSCAGRCPSADERNFVFGLLGPHGTSIDYEDPATGHTITRRADGPNHAFLIVTRPSARRPATAVSITTPTPGRDIKAVHYDDGTTCTVHAPRTCPAKGFATPARAAASLRAPVAATIEPPRAQPAEVPGGAPSRIHLRPLVVRFRAPVATRDAGRFYLMKVDAANRRTAARCGWTHLSAPIAETAAAGAPVSHRIWLGHGCHGVLTVSVRLHTADPSRPDPAPYAGSRSGDGDPLVGTATVRP